MLLPGSHCLIIPRELLRRAITNVNERIGSTIQSKKGKGSGYAEAGAAWTVDLHLVESAKFVSSTKHKFCVSPDYIPGGSDGPTRDQVDTSRFYFRF